MLVSGSWISTDENLTNVRTFIDGEKPYIGEPGQFLRLRDKNSDQDPQGVGFEVSTMLPFKDRINHMAVCWFSHRVARRRRKPANQYLSHLLRMSGSLNKRDRGEFHLKVISDSLIF